MGARVIPYSILLSRNLNSEIDRVCDVVSIGAVRAKRSEVIREAITRGLPLIAAEACGRPTHVVEAASASDNPPPRAA